MAELGFNVLDAAGNLRDMGQVIEEIGYKWQDLTREQQVSLAQTMAGQRQYSNLIALFDNFDKYTEALNTAQNAAGTLQKQQDIYMDRTTAHLNQLKAATQDLYDSLINPDSIQPLIDGLTKVTSITAKFVDALGGGGNILLALGGIGANVFNKQLTQGVQTFIHNINLAKTNTQDLENRIAILRQAVGQNGISEEDSKLFDQYAEGLKAAVPLATKEQYAELTSSMKQVTQAFNKYGSVIKEINTYDNPIKKITENQKETALNFIKKTPEEIQGIYDKLNDQKDKQLEINLNISKSIEETNLKLQEQYKHQQKIREQLQAGNLTKKQRVELERKQQKSIEKTNQIIDQQIQALQKFKDIDFAGSGFEKSKKQIDDLIKLLNQLKDKGLNSADFAPKVKEIQSLLESIPGKSKEEIEKIFKRLNQLKEELGVAQGNKTGAQSKYETFIKGFVNEKNIQSIGRLIGSITQLGTSISITANSFNEFKKGNLGAGFAGLATSLTSVGTAAFNAGKAIKGMGASLGVATGMGVAFAAIELIISGLVAWKQAAEEARQAQIDLNNTTIENQQKNQEEIDKRQELLLTVKDLNKEYENGQITRQDLRNEIENLCDQYGIEQDYIDGLVKRYGDLAQGIRQARIEAAKQKQESLQTQFEAVKDNAEKSDAGQKYSIGYTPIDLSDNVFVNLLSDFGAKVEGQYDTWAEQFWSSLVLPENIEDKINIYNVLSTQLQKHKDDLLYNDLKKWYDDFSASAEKYNDIKEKLDSYLDYDIFSNKFADFDKTDTFEEYRQQRQQLIDSVAQGDAEKAQQVTRAVDKYLKQNYKGLYGKYDETLNYVNELEKRFGDIDQDIIDSIKELDAAHLDELQRRQIDKYENLRDILKEVSQLDLSNVQKVINANPESLQQVAADRYTFFKSLEDQVKAGKSISSKQIERFSDYGASQLAQYFTMMANGQSQMTGDAKQFYETILNFELSGFFDVIDVLQNKAKQLAKFNEYLKQFDNNGKNYFDYERLTQQAVSFEQKKGYISSDKNIARGEKPVSGNQTWTETTFDHDLIKDQLEYLQIFKQIDKETAQNIERWKELNDAHYADKQMVSDIADAVKRVKDQSETYNSDINNVNQGLEQTYHQIYKVLFPTDTDIEESAVFQLSNVLQQLAPESEELSNDLANNAAVAEQLAEAILRFDDAIQDVVDHYDNWLLALQQQNLSLQDKAVLFPQLRDAYADMLDIDGSLLTDDFLSSVQNLEWMKAAIDGDIQAYNNLADAARQASNAMLIKSLQIDEDQFYNDINNLKDLLNSEFEDFATLKVGAELNDEEFLASLSEMLNAMNVSATQASEILRNNLGIDTEIIEVKDTVKEKQQNPNTIATLQQVDATGYVTVPETRGRTTTGRRINLPYRAFSTVYAPDPEEITTTKEAASFALKVTSANKSAGGHFKYTHASRGAGSAGTKRRADAAAKATKAAPKPDTSTKEPTKYAKDDRDIYHDINIEIQDIGRELARVQKQGNKLAGADLIKNLNKQLQILTKQKVKIQQKNELQKLDLQRQKQQLSLLGVTFDEYGHINNYLDVMGNKIGIVNGYIEAENAIISQYNATTDKEAKDAINQRLTEVQRQRKDAEDAKKDLESAIKDYDGMMNKIEDLADQVVDITQQKIQIQISKFKMKVELTLDMRSLQQDYNEFVRNVINADDLFRTSSGDKLYKNAEKSLADYQSYYNVANENSIAILTQQIAKARRLYEETGNSEYLDAMKSYISQLESSMSNMKKIEQDIQQMYLDTVDDIDAQADRQVEQYEYLEEQLQHDIDLVELVYGQHQYDAMQSYYNQLRVNHQNELSFLKSYADQLLKSREKAILDDQPELAEKYLKLWEETNSKINAELKESIEDAKNEYLNAIDKIYYELELKLSNNKGFDYLSMQWELVNKNADQYLDTVNSVYAVQELERNFRNAIDENKNVKAQRALTDLMNQQLDYLKSKDKLTQYDVDRAEKLLQIQQARYALEDSRTAKTSLRLKRDSQGNYSYVYTASEDQVSDAQEKLAKLQNELYNFDKEAYQDNLDDALAATKEYLDKRKDLQIQYNYADEEQKARLAEQLKLLDDNYYQYLEDKATENSVIRKNLQSSVAQECENLYTNNQQLFEVMTKGNYTNFEEMSDSIKAKLIDDLVPGYQGGIQEMINIFYGTGGNGDLTSFRGTCLEAWRQVDEATNSYEDAVSSLAQKAGTHLDNIKKGVDDVAFAYSQLIPKNKAVLDGFVEQQKEIDLLLMNLDELKKKNQEVWDAAVIEIGEATKALKDYSKEAMDALDIPSPSDNNYNGTPNLPSQPQPVTPQSTITPTWQPQTTVAQQPILENNQQNLEKTIVDKKAPEAGRLIEGIAGAIYYGLWQTYDKKAIQKKILGIFGETSNGYMIAEQAYNKSVLKNQAWKDQSYYYDFTQKELLKKYKDSKKAHAHTANIGSGGSFDTGGYTGTWGPEGRLAWLHQKQLVLNADDTKNMLDSVSILRGIVENIGGNISSRLSSLNSGTSSFNNKSSDTLEQNVHIQASFPNVNSKQEIEEAFNDLVNLAAQRAMKR